MARTIQHEKRVAMHLNKMLKHHTAAVKHLAHVGESKEKEKHGAKKPKKSLKK